MNEKIKKQWIDALRSGEYKQGKNVLKKYDQYCCLGVLTDLFCKATTDSQEKADNLMSNYSYWTKLGHSIAQWAGLSEEDPLVPYEGVKYRISLLNDGTRVSSIPVREHTFEEIADIIEKHL